MRRKRGAELACPRTVGVAEARKSNLRSGTRMILKQPKQTLKLFQDVEGVVTTLLVARRAVSGEWHSWKCSSHLLHGVRRARSCCAPCCYRSLELKDVMLRCLEARRHLRMLLCNTYQAPFSTNPRTLAVCRFGQPSAICRRGSMGQTAMGNNGRKCGLSLVQ